MQRFLKVKNYEKYQDARMAKKYRETGGTLPWVKQTTRRLEDTAYARLHPLSRYVHSEMIGLSAIHGESELPYDVAWLENEMHLSYVRKQLAACLEELVETGFLQVFSKPKGRNVGRMSDDPAPNPASIRVQSKEVSTSPNGEVLTPAKPRARKRDELWDTLTEVLGTSPATRSERGRWNSALKELREAGATPETLRERAGLYRRRWPDVSLTATALSAHWGSLVPEPRELTVEERREAHLASLREQGLVP